MADYDVSKPDSPRQPVPVLSLRDVVVYPHMVIPLFVGRDRSVRALEECMNVDKQILLVTQKNPEVEEPGPEDLFDCGTVATVLQMLRLPDGTTKVLVEGGQRVRVDELDDSGEYLAARYTSLADEEEDERALEVTTRSLTNLFEQYVKLSRKVPPELMTTLSGIEDPSRLADTIAAHLAVRIEDKQRVLEIAPVADRMEFLMGLIEGEIDVLKLEKRIRGRVKNQMEKSQREYYLNEQMKAIQKELGDLDESGNDLGDLETKIEKAGMPKEALEKARTEFNKLKMMSPMSAEATVVRNYLDWMLMLPWKKRSKISHDIKAASDILEADHYGLERVKDRILEYLAVQKRVKKLKGPILCLVGPPGVGKTSLGRSLARATGRKFIRMSLGGVRDEAEIRGHRRTYIGSLPGRVLQSLSKVGTRNPLFMLDELDKMSMDFRGDPSSALLEVLDPEQNNTFSDHYLEVDFDLSEVMFVATANSLNIPAPLLDRMEIIRIPGYTEDEKLNIATRYLLPKQLEQHGLKEGELQISEGAITDMIRHYTREAGVRNLEREIAKVCRKVVKELSLDEKLEKRHVTVQNLDKYLGVRRFRYGRAEEQNEIGQVTGLAWTEVGGELLQIEATALPGKGKLTHTGQLGDVMKESVQAALSVVRSRAAALGIPEDFHQNRDLHVHVPEGATPKDGPSAGIAMVTALVSVLSEVPVRADVAMTGEITLRGKVLPIGGLKEKLLAALRGGIRLVVIPEENKKDLDEIPDRIKKDLEIRPVKWIDEVLELALVGLPPVDQAGENEAAKSGRDSTTGVRAH
ncbi:MULTISPECIES: endopeptidase La [unclassified Wenzhouxiangella]|uniref:endopeptidase La n=1 Tax=unclassified Wenzhouxiangella TaxID=2613841 RepID=UPI000E32B61F|nr:MULTISPECIES: endopeptidase La [unclassified Wenzhouxiangella]RFF26290.1 endopeptidase La [Wenzhouxiangella sp. 15181]RFP67439.1 endopeptidase La [Wenzhouxiangella sp. 15190]